MSIIIRALEDYQRAIEPVEHDRSIDEVARDCAEFVGIAPNPNVLADWNELVNRKPPVEISADEHGRRSAEAAGIPARDPNYWSDALTSAATEEARKPDHGPELQPRDVAPLSAPPIVEIDFTEMLK